MTINWMGTNGARAWHLRRSGLTAARIAFEIGTTKRAVENFFRRQRLGQSLVRAKRRNRGKDDGEGRRWVRKGTVFADPLLSRLWVAHPEYRPRELINRLLPARAPQYNPKPSRSKPVAPIAVVVPEIVPNQPKIVNIQEIVCHQYDIPRYLLISQRRNKRLVTPRHVAIFLSHELTGHSMPVIARAFGNRDHTSILHAVRKIKSRMATDSTLRNQIEGLRAQLGA